MKIRLSSLRGRWFLGLYYNGKTAGNMTSVVLFRLLRQGYLWKKRNGNDQRNGCAGDGRDSDQGRGRFHSLVFSVQSEETGCRQGVSEDIRTLHMQEAAAQRQVRYRRQALFPVPE